MDQPLVLRNLIQSRRSIRKFSDKKVERKQIMTCIEAARLAPSAENVQPWRFIVFDDPQTKRDFGNTVFSGVYAPSRFALKAPVIIAVLARKDLIANVIGKQIQGTSWYLVDIGIAVEHLVLQAQELGIDTCWIGWFHAKKARSFLHISPAYRVSVLIAMGYRAEYTLPPQKRKSLQDIVSFNGMKNK